MSFSQRRLFYMSEIQRFKLLPSLRQHITIIMSKGNYSLASRGIFFNACLTPRSPRTSSAPARTGYTHIRCITYNESGKPITYWHRNRSSDGTVEEVSVVDPNKEVTHTSSISLPIPVFVSARPPNTWVASASCQGISPSIRLRLNYLPQSLVHYAKQTCEVSSDVGTNSNLATYCLSKPIGPARCCDIWSYVI